MAAKLTDNEKAKLAIRALNEARRQRESEYEKEHPGRFQELIERNRIELGLPPRPRGDSPEELRDKLRRAEERAERLRHELELYE